MNNYKEICNQTNYILSTYGEQLNYIFKGFITFGDPFNEKYMKSKIFTKLLMESKLVYVNNNVNKNSTLKMNEIDTIFIKLANLIQDNVTYKSNESTLSYRNLNTNNNNVSTNHFIANNNEQNYSTGVPLTDNGKNINSISSKKPKIINSNAKINFLGFIIGIEVISRILYPFLSPKEAVDYIINEHIIKNLANKEHYGAKVKNYEYLKVQYYEEKQNNNELNGIIGIISKSFGFIFRCYADKRGLLNFNQFLK
jgi:hypothetical protein